MSATRRTYAYHCTACGAEITLRTRPVAGLTAACARTECIAEVTRQHNAAVAEREELMRDRRRAAARDRVPRRQAPLYGDYAWVAVMNGVRTDGTGKAARRVAEQGAPVLF